MHDGGFGRKMFHGIINLGMARAVAGIGLGYLFAIEWRIFTEKWKHQDPAQKETDQEQFLADLGH